MIEGMAEVRIRKLEEWVVNALRSRARRQGRSLEGKLRELLREEAMRPRAEAANRAQAMREAIAHEHGLLPDSATLIREDRDTRG
jgi:plasmid stability protein